MPTDTLVVVADAHLGANGAPPASAFHRFLDSVPDLGDQLLINGDLFEFLFVHRRSMPRSAFPTLAALARLRARGVPIHVTGGNHDRWARDLWEREVGAVFTARTLTLTIGARTVRARHGDGLMEPDRRTRFLNWFLGLRGTVAAFGWLHPDLAGPLVDRFARASGAMESSETHEAGQRRQEIWVRQAMLDEPDVDIMILAHTHRAAVEAVGDGRWYVNPGAWMEGSCYALIPADGPPRLAAFDG